MALKLHIVVASTRPGRIGPTVARWFHDFAAEHKGFDAELIDLEDFKLPVFDEPEHPRRQAYEHEHTRAWSESVARADAFVFVTPEYNYFPTPALVNALDYLVLEWAYKPAGFVSYGGVSGGLRAVEAAKSQIAALRMVPIPEGVPVPAVTQWIADGRFNANELHRAAAANMLGELAKWASALKGLRS